MHQSVWITGGNPGYSDSFLTSHPEGYDSGVQTQGQFWHLKRFPPPGVGATQGILTAFLKRFLPTGVGDIQDRETKGEKRVATLTEETFKLSVCPGSACGGRGAGDSHWLVHKSLKVIVRRITIICKLLKVSV